MKVVIGVVLVIAAIFGISPYFVGGKIESAAQSQLSSYQMPGYQYSLEVERGYRSSVLTYGFSLDPQIFAQTMTQDEIDEMAQMFEQFEFQVRVQHGPLLTQNGLGFGLADAYMHFDGEGVPNLEQAMDLVGVDYLFEASGRMGFSGDGRAEYNIPAMSFVNPETVSASSFAGMEGVAEFEKFGLYSKTSATSEGASFGLQEGSQVEIGKISLSSEMNLQEDMAWLAYGDSDLSLESVSVNADGKAGILEDLSFEVSVSPGDSPESTDIEYRMGLDFFEAEDLSLDDAEFAILYENISNLAMQRYMELAMKLPLGDEQAVEAALMQFAITELPDALQLSPAIELPIVAFSHEGRSFVASFRTSIDQQLLPDTVSFMRHDLLIPAVTADLSLDADESLVMDLLAWQAANSVDASFAEDSGFELTPEMRQTMIDQQATMSLGIAEAQGFVLRNDGRVKSNLHLVDRVLDINGTEMPLPF